MDWKALFLSPKGRINRAPYWIGAVIIDVVFGGFYAPIAMMLQQKDEYGNPNVDLTSADTVYISAFGLLSLFVAYVGIMLVIKRYHDRDKSGWWLFIAFVPIIGAIWQLIEIGFLRGTVGPNRFGPDPLASKTAPVAFAANPPPTTW